MIMSGNPSPRNSHAFFFTASFFTPFYITLIFGLVTTILTENQFVRFTVFIIPFLVVLAATVLGVVFTVRKIKAKRMIIAGGAAIVIFVVMNFANYNASVIYNFQQDRGGVGFHRFLQVLHPVRLRGHRPGFRQGEDMAQR